MLANQIPKLKNSIKLSNNMWVYTQGFKGIKKLLNNITKFMFTAWKNPIILMATTGIGFGILGEGLMILAALLIKCTTRVGVHLCVKMVATTSILCACELTL